MAVKDVETPLAGEEKQETEEPKAELVETSEGLEAEIPDENSPSWKEKKRKRLEEYKSLEEERNRLREENERLRAQPVYQQPYQAPAPQPRPEETEFAQVEERLQEIKDEKELLWRVGQNTTDRAELDKLAKRADKLTEQQGLLSARKAMLVYGTHQPAQQTNPQQAHLAAIQGEFQDVYSDERARVKAEAVFKAAQADGKKASPELLKESLLKARSWKNAGYRDAAPVSQSLKLRTSGERSGGAGTGGENRVKVTSEVTKWAKAMYPKLPEREAVSKYLGGQGKAVQGIQSKKAG